MFTNLKHILSEYKRRLGAESPTPRMVSFETQTTKGICVSSFDVPTVTTLMSIMQAQMRFNDQYRYALVIFESSQDLMLEEVRCEEIKPYFRKFIEQEVKLFGISFSEVPFLVEVNGEFDLNIEYTLKCQEEMAKIMPAPNSRYHEESFHFRDLINWDDELHRMVKRFKAVHGVYPHIMLASSQTYSRIEMVANARGRENIQSTGGEASQEPHVKLGYFQSSDYLLEFCLEEELAESEVRLVLDDGGGGDKEHEYEKHKTDKATAS